VNDVNPNAVDRHGQTALSVAAWEGHEEVVRLLLGGRGVNRNIADKYGKRALSLAVEKGHLGVVKILLEHGLVNPVTEYTYFSHYCMY